MSRLILSWLFLALTLQSGASWSANCKKGKPCGNSCISWDKTCRIGSSYSPPPASSYSPPPATLYSSPSTAQPQAQQYRPAAAAPLESGGTLPTEWVADPATRVYFRGGCEASRLVPQGRQVRIRHEQTLIGMGYKRSNEPGC